jgi:hypothetical protein
MAQRRAEHGRLHGAGLARGVEAAFPHARQFAPQARRDGVQAMPGGVLWNTTLSSPAYQTTQHGIYIFPAKVEGLDLCQC